MAVDSAADLVNALRLSQLLAPAQLEEVSQNLQPACRDARALARALLEREWLTAYQINMLLQGACDKLVLGPYAILERLGDNVLGQVYKARHALMNRAVALTIIREELLAQPQTVEQFYTEIQAISQLSDPHIVHAYDAGPIGRTHFFAMEYVDGIDLDRLVQQSGRMPVGVACAFVHQAALGLQHAYERGLLHHDLRPANLLLAKLPGGAGPTSITARTPLPSPDQLRDASIKIANLGLTLLQPKLRRNAPTKTEDALDYVAPEQVESNATPDIRANLYSLGCVFYFLLTGRAPFAGTGSSVKLKQHQTEEPKPLDAFRRDVPPELRDIIGTLLAKAPQERYQSPADLLGALGGVSLRAPLPPKDLPAKPPSRPVPRPVSWQTRFRPFARRYACALAGSVAALVLALALGAWLLRGSSEPAETTTKTAGPAVPATLVPTYVKKATRLDSILATLAANGLPTFEGKWWSIAPFDNSGQKGFDAVYPPETEINLAKSYTGKDNLPVQWKEWPEFRFGAVQDLKPRSTRHDDSVIYLYLEFEATQPAQATVSFGSDDTLTVWFNGERVVAQNVYRGAQPDQALPALAVQSGKNRMLIKVCNGGGPWDVYVMPRWPDWLTSKFQASLDRDFPPGGKR